jgi:hypothetical protein
MLDSHRAFLLTVICAIAVPAPAQTSSGPQGAFVDVYLHPDWDDARNVTTYVPGATWGRGFVVAFDAGAAGIEVDIGAPQWHVKTFAPQRYQYVGPSYGYEQQGHSYETSSTSRRRATEVSVLYRGNRSLNRYATFTWAAGGGFIYRPEENTTATNEVLPDGRLGEAHISNYATSDNYVAAVARLEGEFRVARKLSVVPRLRVRVCAPLLDDSHLAPQLVTARPEVAVRVRF